MPKFNPSSLPPVPTRQESREFTTKSGESFSFTVAISDAGEQQFSILDKRDELWEKWAGGYDTGPGCAPVSVSKTLCFLIARLLLMQVPSEGEAVDDLWQFPAWATLMQRDPGCFLAINAWVNDLVTGEADEDDEHPNAPAASPQG
ncbi:hypothetical protein [Armatimonas sp.]|uniref:hypothetical protein n=1 Tax=Armatimonas sp. TaxID=1872638 RepID=UPI00374DF227